MTDNSWISQLVYYFILHCRGNDGIWKCCWQNLFFITCNVCRARHCFSTSVCLSVRPSVRPSVCLSVCPSLCPSVRPSICLSCLSVCLSYLSVCLSVCLPVLRQSECNSNVIVLLFDSLVVFASPSTVKKFEDKLPQWALNTSGWESFSKYCHWSWEENGTRLGHSCWCWSVMSP